MFQNKKQQINATITVDVQGQMSSCH